MHIFDSIEDFPGIPKEIVVAIRLLDRRCYSEVDLCNPPKPVVGYSTGLHSMKRIVKYDRFNYLRSG